MTNFEEMYEKFCLSEENKEVLVGFSKSEYSRSECAVEIKQKTIVLDDKGVETITTGEE